MGPTLRRLSAASIVARQRSPSEPPNIDWSRRLRGLLRHIWLFGIASLLAIAGILAVFYYILSLPDHLKIAVGPPESDDVRAVEAIANQLKRERSNFRLKVIITPNPVDAAKQIDSGAVDLAVVRRDLGMSREGAALAILRTNVVVMFVPSPPPDPPKPKTTAATAKTKAAAKTKPAKKTKAKSAEDDDKDDTTPRVADLVGKRVGIIGRSQANVDLLKIIVRQYGIAPEKVVELKPDEDAKKVATKADEISVVHFDPSFVRNNPTEFATAARDAKVDAVMAVGPVGSPITAAAITALTTRGKEGPSFISIGAAEAIAQRHPIYEAAEIKAGAFGGAPPKPEEDTDTVSFSHYVVARRSLNEQTVGEFTRTLFSIRQSIIADVSAEKSDLATTLKIEAPSTDKDAPVALHPGAAAFFNGDQKTFFDRYSDLLYWGLMLFSFSGSAVAGVIGLSKVDDRERRLKVLERLLELMKAARQADSIEGLDGLQNEVDDILREMVQEVESNALDEAALMAFSVTMDQAQHAVNERRHALMGRPAKARRDA